MHLHQSRGKLRPQAPRASELPGATNTERDPLETGRDPKTKRIVSSEAARAMGKLARWLCQPVRAAQDQVRPAFRKIQPRPAGIVGVLRTLFRDALIQELIDQSPVALPRGLVTQRGKKRERYAIEDVARMVMQAGTPSRAVFNALASYTGMRKGEIAGRQWRDLDRGAKPLWALIVHSQWNDQPLKTDDDELARPRHVPVHPELQRILDCWWREGFEIVHCRQPAMDDWIVPRLSKPDRCHTQSSAYKAWRRSCKAAGVTNRSVHSSRHTFVSLARRGGARRDVIERVSHNAAGEIIDQYTHWDWEPALRGGLVLPERAG